MGILIYGVINSIALALMALGLNYLLSLVLVLVIGTCVLGVSDPKVGERIKAIVVLKDDTRGMREPSLQSGTAPAWPLTGYQVTWSSGYVAQV